VAASIVPVIYDSMTKQVLRWFSLDFDSQLSDPAFGPANPNEKVFNIPLVAYLNFGRNGSGIPALIEIQNYINANAP
jgi:hypothetical protein